jgi:hypothetical protein
MPALIRVTDETTIPELYECLALVARTPDTEGRRLRLDALLDEVNARRVE